MNKKIGFILSLMFLFISLPVFAETIVLKSGKTIVAKILEKTKNSIKVDIEGIPITYYIDEIQSIDGTSLSDNGTIQNNLSQTTTTKTLSSGIDAERIHRILKHLGYPEHTWPAIEKELIAFLTKIDFPQLQKEAEQVNFNPIQLKDFVSKLGTLFIQEGCLSSEYPHPLIKLLVTSIAGGDIFQIIKTMPINQKQKEELIKEFISCSTVSQLGSILLESLDINVKTGFAPGHVFNRIPIGDRQILFVDFTNQVFEIADISQYYKLEGKYMVLKEECRISPERVFEIGKRWISGKQRPNTLKEILNLVYFYIYITDDYAATSAIYNNCGHVYNKLGNFPQVISNCTKAIEINPNLAEAYCNRGGAYEKQGNFNQAILDFTKAIEINPNFADAYYGRGLFYDNQGNFPKAISDYTNAIGLNSYDVDAYNNRGVVYIKQCNYDQAISDLSKAIEINPNDAKTYNNRGFSYFLKKDYDKSWDDVHKAKALGHKINTAFLAELKKASGREN